MTAIAAAKNREPGAHLDAHSRSPGPIHFRASESHGSEATLIQREESSPAAAAVPLALRPLFRWPGGKRWLIPRLLPLIPPEFSGRYYEPFFGGGALFFASRPGVATISDRNSELMGAYRAIRDHPEPLEDALRELRTGAPAYYRVRATRPTDAIARAARLIYLTSHAFNGIYRVNRKGEFNVPYGGRTYSLGGSGSLLAYSKALSRAEILDDDFEQAVASARAGDFVYLDPPYTMAHSNNGFLKYNARVFSWRDQERLAEVATRLAKLGAAVVVSNAEHESIHGMYGSFQAWRVRRISVMAPDICRRVSVNEVIYTNNLPLSTSE